MTQQSAQGTANAQPARQELRNRYVFTGKLEMRTGLHIGGGKATLSYTDSPVVLTPDGLPFIPGSSFKGTLRSMTEQFVASLPADLGLHSCGLPVQEIPEAQELCPTAHQRQVFETGDIEKARRQLCHTCQLFGSPFAAAHITVNDLYLINDEWSGTTQIRDGVAIDRDSETAKGGAKYDYEVVPATTTFRLRLVIENATEQDLQLICIGLSEFTNGFGTVGGLRSRGLGACILGELEIRSLDLQALDEQARKQRLLRYLLRDRDRQEDGLDLLDADVFFKKHINTLFQQPVSDH